jgi:PE family
MSYVIAAPEYLAAAASDLLNIGSALTDANSAALGPTSSVFAAGADEVSTAISVLFNAHAQAYQALSEAAQAFHTQFVQLMSGGAQQYVLAEAANASPLQVLQGLVSESTASSQVLTTSQPVASSAASVASAGAASAASAPVATAGGVTGGSAPAASAAPLATTVAPASVVPSALIPAGAPAAAAQAAPIGSSPLVPAGTAQASLSVESEAPSISEAPASATTSAAIEAEGSAFSPLSAIPPVPLSGTSVAAAPNVAPPAAAGPAGTSNEHPAATSASTAPAE